MLALRFTVGQANRFIDSWMPLSKELDKKNR